MEANHQTGQRSVVLVDDYDKPLWDTIDVPELLEHNKAMFRGFFGGLKASDEYLRFVFISGATIFDKNSVFTDLNQLRDISMAEDYAGLCGFTEKEIADYLEPKIEGFSKEQCTSVAGCREQLRKAYGGYLFHHQGPEVCNPGSLLCALSDGIIGENQCISASMIKKILEMGFDAQKAADNSLYATEAILSDYRPDRGNLIPLLYQLGYLSIKGYDSKRRRYTLGFANEEAARALMGSMMPANT